MTPHGGKSKIFLLPYVLDLIIMLEQKFCRDSNLRVKLMFESDVLKNLKSFYDMDCADRRSIYLRHIHYTDVV